MTRKGYTLLEVLVATVIFGIAAVGILSALSTSTRNAGRITERDRAVLLARGKMDELLTTRELPKGVPLQGVWDPALTGRLTCGWTANLSTFELAAKNTGAPVLERVELVVWCGEGDNRRSFALNGYRRGAITPAEAALLTRQSALQ
jgi:prepilin-type N-terminal cleavage/methylation domain-containing protein